MALAASIIVIPLLHLTGVFHSEKASSVEVSCNGPSPKETKLLLKDLQALNSFACRMVATSSTYLSPVASKFHLSLVTD